MKKKAKYSSEFKKHALKLAFEEKYTMCEIADHLEMPEGTLTRWVWAERKKLGLARKIKYCKINGDPKIMSNSYVLFKRYQPLNKNCFTEEATSYINILKKYLNLEFSTYNKDNSTCDKDNLDNDNDLSNLEKERRKKAILKNFIEMMDNFNDFKFKFDSFFNYTRNMLLDELNYGK